MNLPLLTQPVLTLVFGAGGNAVSFAAAGWSDPEVADTWCVGPYSRLVLSPLGAAVPLVLVLDMHPHTNGDALTGQRLRVTAGGHRIGSFTVCEPGLRACVIPAEAIVAGQTLDLVFETPDARRPSSLGGSTDDRPLAIAFRSIRVFAERPSIAPPAFVGTADPGGLTPSDIVGQMPEAELMLKFASLGENCEFGLVQRFFGAEPNDLLRFASAPLPNLLAALEASFDGLGDSDSLNVELSSNGREFLINDLRYGVGYHAWAWAGRMTAEALHEREARRLPPLVRRFLSELTQGAKLWVFKGMGALDAELVYPLAVFLRRYGPNTLLFVTLADAEHPPATVELRAPGFIVAHISRFAPGDNANDLLGDEWLDICRRAMTLAIVQADASVEPLRNPVRRLGHERTGLPHRAADRMVNVSAE